MAARVKFPPKLLFLHIGWADGYKGEPEDMPKGTFGYMRGGGKDVGEACNFKPYRGRYYGYAPVKSINMGLLGAAPGADSVDGVRVVWTATKPGGGRYIVGWYNNAKVYAGLRDVRPDDKRPESVAVASASDCRLLDPDDRTFYVPRQKDGRWTGQPIAYYPAQKLLPGELREIHQYVEGKPSIGFPPDTEPDPLPVDTSAWQEMDREAMKRVELAAVTFVTAYFSRRGWSIDPLWERFEQPGWDLTASMGARRLFIEVKGRAASGSVELSANEYTAMTSRKTQADYRLAIVHNATGKTPMLTVFSHSEATGDWRAGGGKVLKLVERVSARASF